MATLRPARHADAAEDDADDQRACLPEVVSRAAGTTRPLRRTRAPAFAEAVERAYKTNEILREEGGRFSNLTYVDAKTVYVAETKRVEGGFVVHLRVDFGYGKRRGSDGTTTASVHADDSVKVSYFVGERVVRRVQGDRYEHADPTTALGGTVLWCAPESGR